MKLPTRIPLATAALLAGAALASAQTPAAPRAGPPSGAATNASATTPVQLEEVRVTADLWESPLERIPASVSVYDDAALRAGAVRHFADLVDAIPNLTWTGGTSRPRYFQIRGIGENSQFEGETPDSTVRFLIDDLDFTGLGGLASAFDVHQIEVLRGPQAGAFGANAAGGLVRVVTNAPTPFWAGRIEGGIGEDDLRTGGFAVGGPLLARAEDLMARLAFQRSASDGFRRNVTLNRDTNARDETSARLRLTWNALPGWRWEAALLYANQKNGYDEFALNNNGRLTYSDQPGRDEQRSRAASLRGTYAGLAGARLTTVTTGGRVRSRYSYDDDWTAASYMGFSDLGRVRDTFSQELRLDSTAAPAAAGAIERWTLGAYFARTHEDTHYTDTDPGNIRGLDTTYRARNTALFGQASHRLAPATRLVLGLRTEWVDLAGRGTKTRFRTARGTFDPAVTLAPAFDDTLLGGKLTLEHDLSPRVLAFASVARGYKAGGINIDARISPPADPLTYATEYLWNYEVGLRGSALDQQLFGELTAFYLERQDTQVRDSAGFGGSYRFFTANGRRAHVTGLEAAATYLLTREWSLRGSLALMDSALDRFTLANGNSAGGRRLANTPPYGFTVSTRYTGRSGLFGQVELTGRGRQYDSNNQNEARRAFALVNANLGYTRGAWTFSVWVRNALDRRYEKRVYFFGNEDPDYIETRYENRADPRQLGASAAWRF
jgi:outer membrane receptor protein involved in Fe transport